MADTYRYYFDAFSRPTLYPHASIHTKFWWTFGDTHIFQSIADAANFSVAIQEEKPIVSDKDCSVKYSEVNLNSMTHDSYQCIENFISWIYKALNRKNLNAKRLVLIFHNVYKNTHL